MTRTMRAIALAIAVMAVAAPTAAQTPQEAADWLKGLGIKLNYKDATPELVLEATAVDFNGLARDKTLDPADLAKLKAFPKLIEVGLGNRAGNDQTVAALVKATPKLERLSVHNSAITDAALADIGTLSELFELKMFLTKTTNAGAAHLAKLAKLTNLDISSTGIGDAGLESIRRVPALRSLWFNSMKGVTRKGMAAIAAMPALRNLVLQSAEINEEIGRASVGKECRL